MPNMRNDREGVRNDGQGFRNEPDREPRIAPLKDLDDFDVADHEPDIRGWTVRSADNEKVGKVKELIADTGAMKVRYMEVALDKKTLRLDDDRHVLVPIGAARLNDDDDEVLINRASTEFASLPAYRREDLDRGYEDRLRSSWGASASGGSATRGKSADYYDHEHFDDRNFFGKRRSGRENEAYITRSEEEMAVRKQRQRAGEVDVRKHVESERVSKSVPVEREEVSVERRPASGRHASGEIGEDEVRIPVMEEEATVEKRTVPKEEIVVKKHAVQDRQRVEADLKRERVDVDKRGSADREKR